MKFPSARILLLGAVTRFFLGGLLLAELPARTDRYGDPLPPGAVARLGTMRLRPGHTVAFLAALPDGKRFLSVADKLEMNEYRMVMSIWRTATGKLLHRFEMPIDYGGRYTLSSDGKTLAIAGLLNHRIGVLLWDVETGKIICNWPYPGKVLALGFSADGKTLATAGNDRELRLWDIQTGRELRHFRGGQDTLGELYLSRDGKVLALAKINELKLEIWDTASGELRHRYDLGPGNRQRCAFSPDGKILATVADEETKIHLFEVASGREKRSWDNEFKIAVLAFSPDSKTLAAGNGPSETGHSVAPRPIRLWDVNSDRELRRLPGHYFGVYAMAFSPDGKQLLSGGNGEILHFWDVASGKDLLRFDAHEGYVSSITFSPDGRLVATGGIEGAIRLWDAATGKHVRAFQRPPRQAVRRIVFTHDCREILSTAEDESFRFWEVTTGRPTRSVKVASPGVQIDFAFSPDGSTLAACPYGGAIRLLDAATGKERLRWEESTSINCFLCFSPDGKELATVSFAGGEPGYKVELLDTVTAKQIHKWKAAEQGPIAFSGDGRTLFMGESIFTMPIVPGKRTFHAWDTVTGEDKPFVIEQSAWLHCLTCSPNGQRLAWGDQEGIITLWDIAQRQVVRRFKGHLAHVASLAFSPDGKKLVSGSADTTALVWDVYGDPAARHSGPLSAERVQGLWQDLASKDAAKAFNAVGQLTVVPEQAIPLLREHLRPVSDPADAKQVARLLTALDSDQFTVRDKAMKQLRQLDELIEPTLRQALQDKTSLEVRKRIEELLEGIRSRSISPERLRELRGIEVLEYIGTPEAQQVLKKLAAGTSNAGLTREAKAALERLAGRR